MTKPHLELGPLTPLSEALSHQEPPLLLYLYGKESYLIQKGIQMIRTNLLDPATQSFNVETLQGKETSASQILELAQTVPMLGKVRLIFIYDADKLVAHELNQLLPYVESPNPSTCLCFVAETADTRVKFFGSFKKSGLILKLDPLTERQVPAFLRQEAMLLQVRLTSEAIDALIRHIGTDLGQLHHAVERLSCFIREPGPIQASDVDMLFFTNRSHTIFELMDALGAQNQASAMFLLQGLLQDQEPALRILAMLTRHLRQLWQVKDLVNQNAHNNSAEIAQALGIQPFVVVKLLQQTKAFSEKKISQIHEMIYQTERSLKNTRLDDAHYLESLLLQMCHKDVTA